MGHLNLNLLSFAVLFLGFGGVSADICEVTIARDYFAVPIDSLADRTEQPAACEGKAITFLFSGDSRMSAETDGKEIKNAVGTIRLASPGSEWYGIAPDDEQSILYAPSILPAEFKKDGLRVRFSGKVGEIPPNVRMWGIPLDLTKIDALDSDGQ